VPTPCEFLVFEVAGPFQDQSCNNPSSPTLTLYTTGALVSVTDCTITTAQPGWYKVINSEVGEAVGKYMEVFLDNFYDPPLSRWLQNFIECEITETTTTTSSTTSTTTTVAPTTTTSSTTSSTTTVAPTTTTSSTTSSTTSTTSTTTIPSCPATTTTTTVFVTTTTTQFELKYPVEPCELKNKLHHLISGQIPDYLRDTYPTFASFLIEYYKFLETNQQANDLLLNSSKWSDVDCTFDMFVDEMRKQYAYDISPKALLERRRLIKFISQYYEAKGSENAAELFFRMMYNDSATIKYPSKYVLKASDGVWIKKKTIKIDTDYDQLDSRSLSLRPAPIAQYLKKYFNGDCIENSSIGITDHEFDTGTKVRYFTDDTPLDNLTVNHAIYYVIVVDAHHIRLATTLLNAEQNVYIELEPTENSTHILTPTNNSRSVFDLQEKPVYLKYHKRELTGLNLYTQSIGCISVGQVLTNYDIFHLEIDLPRAANIDTINFTLSTAPYYDTVWVTSVDDDGNEFVYGFLTQQLTDYKILNGGKNFRVRDSFEVEAVELAGYPIPAQEINNGEVRVATLRDEVIEEYFAKEYATLATEYTANNTYNIISSLNFISTGYRFDITGDYFAESYTDNGDYTNYNTFEETLINPRNDTDALVEFTVGYIDEKAGRWKDNSSFLSDVNKLQDNYYYQPYSYVVQTINTPYEIWNNVYKQSAHPAGFKVFGELLIEYTIPFSTFDISDNQSYVEMLTDMVFVVDTISIQINKNLSDTVYATPNYAPDFFGEDYTAADYVTIELIDVGIFVNITDIVVSETVFVLQIDNYVSQGYVQFGYAGEFRYST